MWVGKVTRCFWKERRCGASDVGGVRLKTGDRPKPRQGDGSEASNKSETGGNAQRAERVWPRRTAERADPTPTRLWAAAGKKREAARPNGRKKTPMSFRRLRSKREDLCFSGLRAYCEVKQFLESIKKGEFFGSLGKD